MRYFIFLLAILTAPAALGCELGKPKLEKEELRYVIEVAAKKNEFCVLRNDKDKPWDIWGKMEKVGIIKADNFGKFFRDYKVSGDKVQADKYIYKAGNKAGSEDIRFIAYGSHPQDYSTVLYKITVK